MEFLQTFTREVINPTIALAFAVGLLVFVVGVVEYIWGLSSDTLSKERGRDHIKWGIIGMFIMAGAYGIFAILARLVNADSFLGV